MADLLRLNTGVNPTPPDSASRLGLLGGDAAGFPNGRRVFDDVTDIALRLVVGGVLAAPFPGFDPNVNGRLGDGVNVNDTTTARRFPTWAMLRAAATGAISIRAKPAAPPVPAPPARPERPMCPLPRLRGSGALLVPRQRHDWSNCYALRAPAALHCAAMACCRAERANTCRGEHCAARSAVAADNGNAEAHAALALGLARRARETSDTAYYDQAQAAAEKSLELAPGNVAGERMLVWVLLGKHEFAKALERAQALNSKIPDDLLTYGFLADANAELGNYEAAEEAAQWMLDLRPGNAPALTRAAYLRELFGDIDGPSS